MFTARTRTMSVGVTLYRRLRTAGIEPSDLEELKLKKQVLLFACGLMIAGSAIWLSIYWLLGLPLSASLPFAFQLTSFGTLLVFLVTLNFNFFRIAQLSLFLFVPFVVQWSIGNFVSASGISLWALLAPVGAVLLYSPRESLPWFAAYVVLVLVSGFADDYLVGAPAAHARVPLQTSLLFFALNFAATSAILYWLLHFAFSERDASRARLEQAHARLQEEQDRSERLLLNILPAPIAERLKHSESTIADGFAEASVMFADIVNFTGIAERMTPQEIFALLNRLFSVFDDVAEQLGLEKIKTIGDAYMVAGGINDGGADYTGALADLALAMRDAVARDFSVGGLALAVRIGIGTGPVVAGVVGRKKFIYDLWGDTVNIANRITAEGAPGMIQVDQATFRKLRERYAFTPPRMLYLKGKGDTPVYHLTGSRRPVPAAAQA